MFDAFERLLGQIETGFVDAETQKLGFQVVRTAFPTNPMLKLYATLGLSNFDLRIDNQSTFNIELITLLSPLADARLIPSLFYDVGDTIVRHRRCPMRGEVIAKDNAFVPGTDFVAVYFTNPLFLSHADPVICRADGRHVLLLWLVLITSAEAAYANEKGWEALESLMDGDLDRLLDLPRPSFV